MPTAYSQKLRHPKWQKKRLQIMERDNFTCTYCGDKDDTQHIHHKKYTGSNPWDAPNEDLITVCECCHSILEHVKLYPIFNRIVKIVRATPENDGSGRILSCFFFSSSSTPSVSLFYYNNGELDCGASLSITIVEQFLEELNKLK